MEHHFNVDIAKEYGVNTAIFLNNVSFWIRKNQANKKNFYEGRYWTYDSSDALTELFPYWSVDQIDRLIKKCVESDLLILGNFNKTKYDRTRWYTLSNVALKLYGMAIPRNRGRQTAESTNPSREIAGYIKETDNKPDNKPDSAGKPVDKSEPTKQAASTLCFLSDDFFPDDKSLIVLNNNAVRCGMTSNELLEKFFKVHKDKHKTRSKNWQKKFIEFCEAELPKKTYEDKTGKRTRYDGKPLY